MHTISDGQDDAMQNDACDWIELNYKAISGDFICKSCDLPTKELVADPTIKKADFECRECATQQVKDDLYDAICN